MQGNLSCGEPVVITRTLAEVIEIVALFQSLPDDFDPAAWPAESEEDIAVVATETVSKRRADAIRRLLGRRWVQR
jgi:hypothetical protein